MKKQKRIVVFGGTGNYGRKIVFHLVQNGSKVIVVSRDKQKALRVLGDQVEILEGDVRDRECIRKALAGTDAVCISLSAMSPKMIRSYEAIEHDAVLLIVGEIQKAKIRRLVYLSVYNDRMDVVEKLGIPDFAELKHSVEQRIRETGLNWTILGCAPMHELFFTFLRKNKLMVPGGGKRPIVTVSDEDVGRIAAQALVRDDLQGKRFRLADPRTYSFPEFAEMVSRKTGNPVQHRTIPLPVINLVSLILYPFNPFFRFIYKSLILLNNFPDDEVRQVPDVHKLLRKTFNYEPRTLEEELDHRLAEGKL